MFLIPCQLIQLGAGLGDPLGRVDHIHGGLERPPAPSKVRHLHHDHAHVLGQHNDVVTLVIPLANLEQDSVMNQSV